MPSNIILLGDPASGKATQGKFLAKKYKLYDLDMGRILREIKEGTHHSEYSTELIATMDQGHLAPTAIVRALLEENIAKASPIHGILFNGTPKMTGEARLVQKWLRQYRSNHDATVVYLHLPVAESLKRMLKRARADDSKAALANRIKYYRKHISAVVALLKLHYKFIIIDGSGTRTQVRARIVKKLHGSIY